MTDETQLEPLRPAETTATETPIIVEVCHAKWVNYLCIRQGQDVLVEAGKRPSGQANTASVELESDATIQRVHGVTNSDCISRLCFELSTGKKLGPYGSYGTHGSNSFDFQVPDVCHIRAKTHNSQNFVQKIYIGQ